MKALLKREYGLDMLSADKSAVGAGSDTFFVTCEQGKFVVKYPAQSEINHPGMEGELCQFLLGQGIPVCQFLRNSRGEFLTGDECGRQFHVQRFIEGRVYELNEAPDWLLWESAAMLGRIHVALRAYGGLPEGIGEGFFRYMTPRRAAASYAKSRAMAFSQGQTEIAGELTWRMELMERFPQYEFDLTKLTCCATHGDYFLSQLICGDREIRAVIDWTTACVHPVVWEIVRSYVYAAPECREGRIDMDRFCEYVASYTCQAPLSDYDLQNMIPLFYYQIAVCDYYGQYYASTADNRHIYLHQARFSTRLLRWLEENGALLTKKLMVFGNT